MRLLQQFFEALEKLVEERDKKDGPELQLQLQSIYRAYFNHPSTFYYDQDAEYILNEMGQNYGGEELLTRIDMLSELLYQDVYATGDGTVVKMGWETGYGNLIIVDHGFGYQTWYAHLQGFRTKLGKRVVRGEVIGAVGSTGKSTGPHLHYEVHVKGQVVNPVNYYFMDLSAEDYDRMIQIAANHGKMMD